METNKGEWYGAVVACLVLLMFIALIAVETRRESHLKQIAPIEGTIVPLWNCIESRQVGPMSFDGCDTWEGTMYRDGEAVATIKSSIPL